MSRILSREEYIAKLSPTSFTKLGDHDLALREKIERMKGLLERVKALEPLHIVVDRNGRSIGLLSEIQAELSRED